MLVVVIIGILSAVAIPALIGQKKSADSVGDAQQNCKTLQLMLETSKADAGVYGAANAVTTWNPDGTVTGTNLAPLFAPKGSTHMTFILTIGATGTTYDIEVDDKRTTPLTKIYETDQVGRQIYPVTP